MIEIFSIVLISCALITAFASLISKDLLKSAVLLGVMCAFLSGEFYLLGYRTLSIVNLVFGSILTPYVYIKTVKATERMEDAKDD